MNNYQKANSNQQNSGRRAHPDSYRGDLNSTYSQQNQTMSPSAASLAKKYGYGGGGMPNTRASSANQNPNRASTSQGFPNQGPPRYGVHPGMFANPAVKMPQSGQMGNQAIAQGQTQSRQKAGFQKNTVAQNQQQFAGGYGQQATSQYGTDPVVEQAMRSLGLSYHDVESPYAREMQQATDWCQIRHNLIRVAVETQGDWLASGDNLKQENNASMFNLLTQYWQEGLAMSQSAAQSMARGSANDTIAWSAAFISWCVRTAMPNPPPPNDAGFLYHARHMAYIAQAARNRENQDATRPFWLFDINDPNVVPEDGDILCLNRWDSDRGRYTDHSFTSVRDNWVLNNANRVATGKSHTDIVIGHFEENGRRWIETIGGNVGDTVGSRYYSLDAQGRLVDQVQLNGNAVNGKQNITQTVGNRPPIVFALIRLTSCANFN